MIVVAIIGILAAIAIPQYADYQQRTKVAGAVSGAGAYKVGVAQCIADLGVLTGCNASAREIPPGVAANNNGAAIAFVDGLTVVDGVIQLTTTATDAAGVKLIVTMTPVQTTSGTGAIDWNLTGTGCDSVTPGRGIKCSGS